jgi:hypothetical protein
MFNTIVVPNYVGCPNYVGNEIDSILEDSEQKLYVPMNSVTAF